MSSTAAASGGHRARLTAVQWFRAGVVIDIVSWLLFVVMQAVKGDWLPPQISVSQYGVGGNGWIFSLFCLAIAGTTLCMDRALPTGRLVRVLLVLGALGCLVMAAVHTDPGGLQQSPRAKIHMVASVFALSAMPIGMCLGVLRGRRLHRLIPWSLTVFSAVCLVLLLVSASGIDTLGVGSNESWAIWQTGAIIAEMVLIVVQTVASRPQGGESAHIGSATQQPAAVPGVTAPRSRS
ncbi:MAG: DUF998 domain-containing protein [Actinomycetota bacterium]|nr:DUF998 domain-containing protein [Actinomycetota bacterium]